LGLLHGQNGRFDEAQLFTGQALLVDPMSSDALFLRSYALRQLGRDEEALLCLDRVLTLNPGLAEAILNRASLLFRLRRYEAAAADYERLLALDPDFPFARGHLMFSRRQICDWRDFEPQRDAILAGLASRKRIVAPFQAKSLGLTPEQELACAQIWASDQIPQRASPIRAKVGSQTRIRVAYVSGDFHAHAMASLAAGLFEHHDKSRFETIAISFGPDDKSDMRARLTRAFDRFIDARGLSEAELAALIQDMDVDIAVDLMGYTENCRPAIFAARAAPVQVNYLGYPGTTGADYIDYLIGDATIIPASEHRHYAEKVVTLPDSFMPADDGRDIATAMASRTQERLPETGFVFCSFNASYKISPAVFDIWMGLLLQIDSSVLWLGQANEAARANLMREAEKRGVPAARLIFADYRQSPADHLARLKLADLFLDTVPYNAHATASDALWVGLPVLTCRGAAFAGGVGASMLHSLDVPELVADSLEAYEACALNLAREPHALAALKAKLERNRGTSALFDTVRYTRNLESAFKTMVERSRLGLPPAGFQVPSS
jgi:predicted O-linked N-acetylglucosamine transferase (SPINDLY family)